MNPSQVVYVVDDDPSVSRALTRLFRVAGLRLVSFATAQEFLDQPDIESPACLVLDVQLPDLNGLDLQKERKRPVNTGAVGRVGAWWQGRASQSKVRSRFDRMDRGLSGASPPRCYSGFGPPPQVVRATERLDFATYLDCISCVRITFLNAPN